MTVKVSPGATTAVPVSVGASVLLVSAATVGTTGGVASMVMGTKLAGLLPTVLVAITLALAAPSASAWMGVTLQVPSAATVVVSTSPVPGMVTVMVSPAVPLPWMDGVVSRVMLSVWLMPVSLATAMSANTAAGALLTTLALRASAPNT